MMERRTSTTPSGPPSHYAYRTERLYVWPVPDAEYLLEAFTVSKLTAITSDTGHNAWVREAEELIRLHAKVDLFENVIREDPTYAEATRLRRREQEVLTDLLRRTGNMTGTGQVRAYYL